MVQSQAQEALQQGDYTLAAKNYIEGNGLPQERKQLTDLFVQVNSLNEAQPNPDLCAILGLIALDDNSAFNLDREEALLQCIQWSRQGLQIDPNHGHCYRNAGSALYWLDDWEAAALYYKKADELVPSPVLKIRLFNMQIGELNNQISQVYSLTSRPIERWKPIMQGSSSIIFWRDML